MSPCQYDGRGIVKQAAHIGIATSRDVPVIVNLAGLIAFGGDAKPGAHGARSGKIGRVLDRGDERAGCHRVNPGDRSEKLALLALASRANKLIAEASNFASEFSPHGREAAR